MSAMFTYTDEDTGLVFQWHGGAYIDVGVLATEHNVIRNNLGQPAHDPGELIAHECINVWDYASDEPTIDRSLYAFEQRCRDWLAGDEDDDEEDDEILDALDGHGQD